MTSTLTENIKPVFNTVVLKKKKKIQDKVIHFKINFSLFSCEGGRKIQSLTKASVSPYGPRTSMQLISKETYISTLKYSITINKQVVTRDSIECCGMEAANDAVHSCLGWWPQCFSRKWWQTWNRFPNQTGQFRVCCWFEHWERLRRRGKRRGAC